MGCQRRSRRSPANPTRRSAWIEVDAVYTGEDKDNTHITSSRGMYNVDESHLILIDDVVIDKAGVTAGDVYRPSPLLQ